MTAAGAAGASELLIGDPPGTNSGAPKLLLRAFARLLALGAPLACAEGVRETASGVDAGASGALTGVVAGETAGRESSSRQQREVLRGRGVVRWLEKLDGDQRCMAILTVGSGLWLIRRGTREEAAPCMPLVPSHRPHCPGESCKRMVQRECRKMHGQSLVHNRVGCMMLPSESIAAQWRSHPRSPPGI